MTDASKNKLFEESLKIYGREYALSVFLMLKPNLTNYYHCILDNVKALDLWINDDGTWIDMEHGPSELCSKIGQIIEHKLLRQAI